MNIPATDACHRMIHRMGMLDHIAAHSIRVCQVASLISVNLLDKGVEVNMPLVTAAALLHDITKTRSFETRENHAETGERYLRDLGYPEVGDLVGQHVRLLVYADDGLPTAAEIVNYADKRVLHDQIVSLEERMAYILERYGGSADHLFERLQWLCDRTAALEKKLFSYMDFSPEMLQAQISSKSFADSLSAYQGAKMGRDLS